ncbi:MAG: SMC family ATPase [Candidatus Micrarchaeota archaeon]|nr:SMC family ATPase [Candidatus Micrarchaeota archaeon]
MINSIELKNWKTHGSTKLVFSKGTNILIGRMGAGKSSVMDAISFALFGTFPAVQHKRTGTAKLIRNKPTQEKKGAVKLEFSSGNDVYTVTREINLNGPTTARLEKNGAYLQSQSERVNEEIAKALKLDYDLFSKAIYSEQNGLDYFLNLRSGERKKQIDALLGLDKFATAQDNATSLINKLKDMVEEGSKTAEGFDLQKTKEQLETLKGEKESIEAEIKKSDAALKSLETDEKEVSSNLARLKKEYTKKTALSKELAEIRGRSRMLQMEIEKLQKLGLSGKDETAKKFDTAEKHLRDVSAEEKLKTESDRKMASKSARLQAELEKLEKDASEKKGLDSELKKRSKADVAKDVERYTSELERTSMDIASNTAALNEGKKWVKELHGHISKCPICERELPESLISKLISEKEASIKHASSELERLRAAEASKRKELSASTSEMNRLSVIEQRSSALNGIESRVQEATMALKSGQSEASLSKAEREKAAAAVLNAREEIEKIKAVLDRISRMEGYLKEKLENDGLAGAKQGELDAIKVDEKEIDGLQEKMNGLISQIGKYRAGIDANKKYLNDKSLSIKEKSDEMKRIEKLYEDIKRKKHLAENLLKFRNSVVEAQTVMRSRLVDSVNSIMDNIWPELYPYGDYQGVALEAQDDDYLLRVRTLVNGESSWEDVESIASGGERSIACLAMRIAFALVLVPNLKWLILDEPTHNIDREGLAKFVQVFNEMLPNVVDQVFIITHDDMLKQVQNARIYLLDRNKEEHKETSAVSL